jgi:protein-S-isoprenylcysteine O-methyltransferase Ste14
LAARGVSWERLAKARERRRFMVATAVYGVLTVCAVALVAVLGLEAVRRLVPAALRQEHNDVAGFIYAVVGVIYAVLLALVVIAAWEEHEEARATVREEANGLADVFWLAHSLPEPLGPRIQELARSYAAVVVEEEWELMARGEGSSPEAWALMDEMRLGAQGIEVRTPADVVLFGHALERVDELADARRARMVEAEEGIPAVLWAVLVLGGVITVGFTYLFGLANTWSHRLMVAAVAGLIGLVLFTVGSLEYPFSGGTRVGPEAFELVLRRFEASDLGEPG